MERIFSAGKQGQNLLTIILISLMVVSCKLKSKKNGSAVSNALSQNEVEKRILDEINRTPDPFLEKLEKQDFETNHRLIDSLVYFRDGGIRYSSEAVDLYLGVLADLLKDVDIRIEEKEEGFRKQIKYFSRMFTKRSNNLKLERENPSRDIEGVAIEELLAEIFSYLAYLDCTDPPGTFFKNLNDRRDENYCGALINVDVRNKKLKVMFRKLNSEIAGKSITKEIEELVEKRGVFIYPTYNDLDLDQLTRISPLPMAVVQISPLREIRFDADISKRFEFSTHDVIHSYWTTRKSDRNRSSRNYNSEERILESKKVIEKYELCKTDQQVSSKLEGYLREQPSIDQILPGDINQFCEMMFFVLVHEPGNRTTYILENQWKMVKKEDFLIGAKSLIDFNEMSSPSVNLYQDTKCIPRKNSSNWFYCDGWQGKTSEDYPDAVFTLELKSGSKREKLIKQFGEMRDIFSGFLSRVEAK